MEPALASGHIGFMAEKDTGRRRARTGGTPTLPTAWRNGMLRSVKSLRDDPIQATDGDLGRIDDIGFRHNDWIVRYGVIDMEERARDGQTRAAE